jgi:L-alanine-DL-glutamate epimerase-like enolase superfamily enzyme
MTLDRRRFLRSVPAAGGAAWLAAGAGDHVSAGDRPNGSSRMTLSYRPYTLALKHVFTLATSSRTTTPVVLTRIDFEGVAGFGEASMPPYLGESHDTALAFLAKVDLGPFADPFQLEAILACVDGIAPGNPAAKASIDIALHDLVGKLVGQPWHRLWGLDPARAPRTSFTIGIDTDEVVRERTREAAGFRMLKVKLGRDTDRSMIAAIRSVTDVPLCADVNQGWTDRAQALDMLHWLAERGVVFVEQPMPKEQPADNAWLTERSPLPIVGDEAVQRLADVRMAGSIYSGINVKLMKSTGLREAHRMMTTARALGLKVLLGCMTETSCGISAAAELSPLADWADLDGALLIGNDPFTGATLVGGRITPTGAPGIGLTGGGLPTPA